MKFVLLTDRNWSKDIFNQLSVDFPSYEFLLIDSNSNLFEKISHFNPTKVFIPHWSYFIPQSVYTNYECILFHMTDLPFGRGGSPLQNLIVRGFESTKISALRVVKELDAGDIYLKKNLSLIGNAEEIFIRTNKIIFKMIKELIQNDKIPIPQDGEIIKFKRRTKEMSSIHEIDNIEELFNYIRMLDAEGYPNAFFENEYFKFEFSRGALKTNKTIIADVRIIKK